MATLSRQPGLHVKLKAHKPRDKMVVAGSLKEMGWWDPSKAPALDWTGEAWETKKPIEIPFDQSKKQLEFKFVRAGESETWEDGMFHRLNVEAPPRGDLELLVSGRFNDSISVQEVSEKAAKHSSRSDRRKREGRFSAAHWRRRFEETQKELFALQREAAAMERQFEEEERQAALEEAALRLQLAKVQGTVEALRKVHEAERADAAQRASQVERRFSESSNEAAPYSGRRGIMTPVSVHSVSRQRQSTGRELQRSGSTIESTASSGVSSVQIPLAPFPSGLRQGHSSIPSLLGPVASTPKLSSPGFGSTTASSKVSVIQETGYVPQELLDGHWKK